MLSFRLLNCYFSNPSFLSTNTVLLRLQGRMKMAFDLVGFHPVLHICVYEMSISVTWFSGMPTSDTELGEGLMVASPVVCLYVNAHKRPVAVSTQMRAYLNPSLTGIDVPMQSICQWHTKQVYLYTCSTAAFTRHSSERTRWAIDCHIKSTRNWSLVDSVMYPLPHLLSPR